MTTLLNPKGLVIAALLPPGGMTQTLPFLAILVGTVAACGCAWVALGAYLRRRLLGPGAVALLGRAGSVVLAGFAALLLARGLMTGHAASRSRGSVRSRNWVVRIISRMRGWISVRQRVPLNTP